MKTVESLGRIDRERHVLLDTPLPPGINGRVRVIILVEDEADDVTEQQWLRAAVANGGFEFLDSPGEDLYTLADGKPFDDAG
jgi:hypothetical protein